MIIKKVENVPSPRLIFATWVVSEITKISKDNLCVSGCGFTGLMHISTNNDNIENDDDTVTMAAEDSAVR